MPTLLMAMRRVSAAPCTSAIETALFMAGSSLFFAVAYAGPFGLPQGDRADPGARAVQHARQFRVEMGRDIFRRGINLVERRDVVEVLVVERRDDFFRGRFDRLEVEPHADVVVFGGVLFVFVLPVVVVLLAVFTGFFV